MYYPHYILIDLAASCVNIIIKSLAADLPISCYCAITIHLRDISVNSIGSLILIMEDNTCCYRDGPVCTISVLPYRESRTSQTRHSILRQG